MRLLKGMLVLLCALGLLSLAGYSLRDLVSSLVAQEGKEAVEAAKTPPELPEHVVARVAEENIYAMEVLGRVQAVESSRPVDQQLVGPAYEYAINARLLELEAKRLAITASKKDKEKEVDDYIERRKEDLKHKFGGQVSWTNHLIQLALTEEKLREMIMEKADLMVLRRRLVNYWEQTTDSAQIVEITVRDADAAAAKKRADDILARIDSDVIANLALAPADRKSVKDIFTGAAILASDHDSTPVRMVFSEEPMDEKVRTAIFTTLKEHGYSTVLKVSDFDYRIIFLDKMRRSKPQAFKDLREQIDKMGPVDNDDRYRRWINAVYRGGRYPVQFRFPDGKTISTNLKKPSEKD